jgi:RNA-binding protein 39
LKNMFDPSTEVRINWLFTVTLYSLSFNWITDINYYDLQTEPDFDLDIKEDVEEECSKYGRVKHIYVDK